MADESGGFNVMTYGGDRYTSIAWFPTKSEAEEEVRRIHAAGAWHGKPPTIEPAATPVKNAGGWPRGERPATTQARDKFLSLLSATEDLQWLEETHLGSHGVKLSWQGVDQTRSVALYGYNEDSPLRVVLYDVERPDVDSVPLCTIDFPEGR